MGLTIVEKIIQSHLVEGEMKAGNEIGIRIDQTLTQDATGTMAYLEFETMGIQRVKTEVSVSYIDHNTLQVGYENADDHRYLQSVAKKYGILFSRSGNGICHQVHLERFARPGGTLIGSDSHTPTCGGMGMLAIGTGGLDVALSMAGGPFYLTMPEMIRINLHGQLREWVSAKDIILKVLSILTTKGNVGKVVEYGGDGINYLTVPERATITNMGAELGVTSSIFPSDRQTEKFLKQQRRSGVWKKLESDPDAHYSRTIDIDVSSLHPMVALPHSPDNVKEVSEIQGLKIDQVAIGSCTNASYRDLMTVAKIFEDRHVADDVSCVVAPGSRQVFQMVDKAGGIEKMISAGARLMEIACGFCIGSGQSPCSKGISLRTSNRNFKARSGTDDAEVYLVSSEVAAVSATKGVLTDPRKSGWKYPKIRQPSRMIIDDSMIISPAKDPESVEIIRGPNIGKPPMSNRTLESYKARVAIKVGDKITTDDIMPAGQRLKYRSNIGKYSEFVFEKIKPGFAELCGKNYELGFANVILAGDSYGQGSSREHAAVCPMHLGVKFVLARSIERIHRANLINFGIIPLVFSNSADYDRIMDGDELSFPEILKTLESSDILAFNHTADSGKICCKLDLTKRERQILKEGGMLNYIKWGAKN